MHKPHSYSYEETFELGLTTGKRKVVECLAFQRLSNQVENETGKHLDATTSKHSWIIDAYGEHLQIDARVVE